MHTLIRTWGPGETDRGTEQLPERHPNFSLGGEDDRRSEVFGTK